MSQVAPDRKLRDHDTLVEVRTTFSRREHALACAERLIGRRLAACVQIDGPVTSIYRWRDAVETAEEFRCTCKTTSARQAACAAAILEMHEYETPELLVTRVRSGSAYAAWVRASVEPEIQTGDGRDAAALG